ncbi:MAG TPA: putative cytokinetic ring protein SteA [Streptosporangiaceae bacterium]|nr:putative cytokinetic ring protein SteA [Streptosporangiaceae bacterium]
MKFPSRSHSGARRSRPADLPGVSGRARLDRRTKNLTRRLEPGEIAIIDHADLDRVSAEALIRRQVAAVVNAASSMTGRYPNLGPQLLVEAGIPLVDDVSPEVFDQVREGQSVRLDAGTLYLGDVIVAKGTEQTAESVAADMASAREGLADQLRAFVTNTMEYITRDSEQFVDGIRLPELRTRLADRHALVVARGYRHGEDLQALRAYIREFKPVMIGVDGGANALLDAGYRPHMIIGDMDSVSDRALNCGAEIVVHAYPNGFAPGLPRVQDLGLDSVTCPATGTSEDVAVLLADEAGASLIVTVGMRFSLVEFLDKGRSGMASAVLTRIRVADKIVDAKGVSRLYQSRISAKALILLGLVALVTVLVAVLSLPVGPIYLQYLGVALDHVRYWLTGLF